MNIKVNQDTVLPLRVPFPTGEINICINFHKTRYGVASSIKNTDKVVGQINDL